MAFYDIFVRHKHPEFLQRLMVGLNRNVLRHMRKALGPSAGPLRILEIGPGKGYFYKVCVEAGDIEYFALDRNEAVLNSLEGLAPDRKLRGEVPHLPVLGAAFDVIYAAFVVEHLANGGQAQYELIQWAKSQLRPGGLLVLQVPDAEKLGMEFWNIDYTHTFPTTKRSIAHAFYDNEVDDVAIYDISGLLTHRLFANRFCYLALRVCFFFYSYKAFNWLAYYLFGAPSWNRGNFFFSVYALCKEENLFVVGKMPKGDK